MFSWEENPYILEDVISFINREYPPPQKKDWIRIATIFNQKYEIVITAEAYRQRYKLYLKESGIQKSGFYIKKEEKEKNITPEKLWEYYEQKAEDNINKVKESQNIKIILEKDEPCYLTFVADQHIGDTNTDHKRMREDQELIRDTDNVYQFWGGDSIDNHIKYIQAMINSSSKPSEQVKLLDRLIGIAGDKIVGIVGGNHDFWTKMYSGLDYLDKYFNSKQIHFSNHRMFLEIYLGNQVYNVAIYHKYRYESSLNLGNAVRRLWEMGDSNFHIGVICHKHQSKIETFTKHGIERWAVRPGSYMINSEYTMQMGYNTSIPTMPTIKIFPDEFKMIGYADLRMAI